MSRDEERKVQILEAALHCFLQFGFAKTSMDDVAKKAGLSRPLIYLKFKNKKDLFQGIYVHLIEGQLEKVADFFKTRVSKKEKVMRLCELTLLAPWDRLAGHPMSQEFYDVCWEYCPTEADEFTKKRARLLQSVLHDKELVETFLLALEGLHTDLPSTKVLRRRIEVMIDRFVD